MSRIKQIFCACSVSIALVLDAAAQIQVNPDATVGLDQVTVLVSDLDATTSSWRLLGFSVQPPADAANTTILMVDGTSLRLTTQAAAEGESQGQALPEGAIAASFRAKDMDSLAQTLRRERVAFTGNDVSLELASRQFDFLSFTPESSVLLKGPWSAHPNGASSIIRLWLATDRSNDLTDLLVALGGERSSRWTYVPERTRAKVVAIGNGEVVMMAKAQELTRNRPIVGATIQIADIEVQEVRLARANIPFTKQGGEDARIIVAPAATHGMWLEFRE